MEQGKKTHARGESFSDQNIFPQGVDGLLQNDNMHFQLAGDIRSSGGFGSKIEVTGSGIEGPAG